ncbi:permease [Paenibacillus filicis]|uniref:Permease n=1 Tax=Paenibacillus gyeongsangnamensis TaxID=3388067 RepID=A0ABT4QAC0_9BACL|nr:permease [Paenibacillus filicis]MCZ8513840.1 permease [Paenibacillus filicis]
MQTLITRWAANTLAVLCLVMLILIFTQRPVPDLSFLSSPNLQSFKTLFISIILEALPFVLLGVLVSALLQQFVSEQRIRRMIPKNPVLGIVFACVMGIIFPLCECGMIPVIRRLLRKGMPVYVAAVFILVGPIINPVVFASTYMAFRSRPEIAYSRMGLAFVAALAIGLILHRFVRSNPVRGGSEPAAELHIHMHEHTHHHHEHHTHHEAHHHDHDHHGHNHGGKAPAGKQFLSVLGHASDEFFEMGKYLIFGAFLTAAIQTVMDRSSLVSIGQGEYSSHLFMAGLAFVLSLCSTSDAFVASSFATTFSTGSLLTFLVFGPMLDIKSTLMLLSAFKARFVVILSLLVIVVVLSSSILYERFFLT